MEEMRCKACNRKLAEIKPPAEIEIKCPRCGVLNEFKGEVINE